MMNNRLHTRRSVRSLARQARARRFCVVARARVVHGTRPADVHASVIGACGATHPAATADLPIQERRENWRTLACAHVRAPNTRGETSSLVVFVCVIFCLLVVGCARDTSGEQCTFDGMMMGA